MTVFTLWRDLPAGLRRDQITLPPHAVLDCAGADWRDCVLVVEDGSVVLLTAGGELPLPQGAVFCLTGCAAPVLYNPGPERTTVTRARRVRTEARPSHEEMT